MPAPWSRSSGRGRPSADSAPPVARPLRRTTVQAVVAVAAIVLILGTAMLPSPYAIERPGPVYDTLGSSGTGKDRAPLITIEDRKTYPTTGRLDLLTVSLLGLPSGGPSWPDLAVAWLDRSQAVIPLEAIYPTGTTQRQADTDASDQMKSSQRSAIAAALTELGEDTGATVTIGEVRAGTAADGVLEPGDVVERYGTSEIGDACTLQNDVVAGGARPQRIMVLRDGQPRTVTVTPRSTDIGGGQRRPLLGVTTSASFDFPFPIDLRIDDVGGPSAGMMFALGIIDKLTPGSMTGGRHVAGTGTICGDGTVGPIGGIVQKLAAARSAGATLFLAPAGDCDEVVGHVPSGLDVVAVNTLSDALEALEKVRTTGSTAGLPTCSAPVGSAG